MNKTRRRRAKARKRYRMRLVSSMDREREEEATKLQRRFIHDGWPRYLKALAPDWWRL